MLFWILSAAMPGFIVWVGLESASTSDLFNDVKDSTATMYASDGKCPQRGVHHVEELPGRHTSV